MFYSSGREETMPFDTIFYKIMIIFYLQQQQNIFFNDYDDYYYCSKI